jgi:single-strand DNA-binding protein
LLILFWESQFPGRGDLPPEHKTHSRAGGFNSVLIRARTEEVSRMASRGVNKVILVGNLGANPDIRFLANGDRVTVIRLATGEVWKDQNGTHQERTEWHQVVFYRRLAEIAGELLKKGSKIYIEGSLRTQPWEKNGEKRTTTEVVANDLQILDRANGHEAAAGNCDKPSFAKPRQHRSNA